MERLGITADGKLTKCYSSDENIGKGRCFHVEHAIPGESDKSFIDRVSNLSSEDIKVDKIKISNISKFDFSLPDNHFENKSIEQIGKEFTFVANLHFQLKNILKNDSKFFFKKEIEGFDEEEFKKLRAENYDKMLEFNEKMDEFKKTHSDWYDKTRVQMTFKPSEETKEKVTKFISKMIDADEKCYWYFRSKSETEQYKKYMNERDEFKIDKNILKKEFKEDLKKFTPQFKEDTGWVGEAELKSMCKKVKSYKYTQLRAISIEFEPHVLTPEI